MQAAESKLAAIQSDILEWSQRNFGTFVDVQKFINLSSFLGMVEELGELAHAILKQAQGIRGTKEEHDAAIDDSIADLLVYTLDFCGRNSKDCEGILNRVWAKVKERDWQKNNQTGDANVAATVVASKQFIQDHPAVPTVEVPDVEVSAAQVLGKKDAAEEQAEEKQFVAEHPDAHVINIGHPQPKSYNVPVIRDIPPAEEGEAE